MSTAMTTIQVPAHIAARIAARTGQPKSAIMAAVSSGGVGGPVVSIKGGRYRLKEDGVETVVGINLDVVIVGANPRVSKIFYAEAYTGAENVRPTCASDDGITPNPDVDAPVSPNCATCPNNILGSKTTPTGAKSKKCADQRHLAVVPAADPTKVYGISVPVSGMKGLREYFKDLDNYGLVVEDVITTLGFDDQAEYPKMTFKQKENGFVPEAALPAIAKIMESEEVKVATRTNTRAAAPAIAAPQQPAAYSPPPLNIMRPEPAPTSTAASPPPPQTTVTVQQVVAPAPAPAPAPVAPPADTTPSAALGVLEGKLAALFA
jgi:hypothetical protein